MSHERKDVVDTLYMGQVESSCTNWVPLEDWRGETFYLEVRGVDYIARLLSCESPVVWYDRQGWANLDQASKHLEVFRFRDLSPTPIP